MSEGERRDNDDDDDHGRAVQRLVTSKARNFAMSFATSADDYPLIGDNLRPVKNTKTYLNGDLGRGVCVSSIVTDLESDDGACLDVDPGGRDVREAAESAMPAIVTVVGYQALTDFQE